MTTEEKIEMAQNSTIKLEEIWRNLVATDREENHFQFSNCRNRHIVVLGSQKTNNFIVGDVIRRDTYAHSHYHPRADEQNTITYIMVPSNSTCNVCIVNLIDIPSLEYFIKRSEKHRKDCTSSPMTELDKTIDKFATRIDLIVLVCESTNLELMKSMKKWAGDRQHIMALVLIVDPKCNAESRENLISCIRNEQEFQDAELNDFFEKGIFCISDFSYNNFQNPEEQKLAQSFVKEWRSKFLRTCVGSPNDSKYEIILREEKHTKHSSFCHPS